MREGYIKLYRSLLENPLYNIKPYSKGQAWITILLLTNHSASFINVKNGTLVKVEKGQCGYSEKALADLFGWSRGKLRRFLEQLKKEKMIQQKIIENHSIITVLNYKYYQMEQQKRNKTVQQTVQQTDTNNNEKNINSNTSYINSSSSSSIEEKILNLTEDEEEILKTISKRNGVKYFRRWLKKVVENNDHIELIKEERLKQAKKEEKKKQLEAEEIPVITQEEDKKIREIQKKFKEKMRDDRRKKRFNQ